MSDQTTDVVRMPKPEDIGTLEAARLHIASLDTQITQLENRLADAEKDQEERDKAIAMLRAILASVPAPEDDE